MRHKIHNVMSHPTIGRAFNTHGLIERDIDVLRRHSRRFTIDRDRIGRRHFGTQRRDRAIDSNAPRRNPRIGLTPRAQTALT